MSFLLLLLSVSVCPCACLRLSRLTSAFYPCHAFIFLSRSLSMCPLPLAPHPPPPPRSPTSFPSSPIAWLHTDSTTIIIIFRLYALRSLFFSQRTWKMATLVLDFCSLYKSGYIQTVRLYYLQIICFMLSSSFFFLSELGKWPLQCWIFARCTFVLFLEVLVAAVQIEPLIDTPT